MKAAAPDRIPAAVLFREIKARGYDGGETRLKQFVRGLMPAAPRAPIVRFETEPGHQMQADWATVGQGADKLKVFIATLGWSRAAYVEFCDDEKVETLLGAHENALLSLRRRAARGALRQHADGRHRAEHLRPRRAPLPCRLPRLRAACGLPAAPVPAVPGADQGQGRAVHRLPEGKLLGAIRRVHAPGRPEARQACGQRGRGKMAARGGQRARACNDQRGPGRPARGRDGIRDPQVQQPASLTVSRTPALH